MTRLAAVLCLGVLTLAACEDSFDPPPGPPPPPTPFTLDQQLRESLRQW